MGNIESAPEDRFERYITFKETKFAEGRFRNAFMGTWVKPYQKSGDKCVVKNKKSSCCWSLNDWDVTLNIVKKAKQLSQAFNDSSGTSRPIHFTDVEVFTVIKRSDSHSYPKVNEYITVEEYLPGEFKKWCNNYGYISDDSISLPAFMHWSWVHTRGKLMIGDLQGVKYSDRFILTDPVIMSMNGDYGATDTGVEGMVMFFIHHKCNAFCQDLPRPKADDFYNHPQLPIDKVKACIETVKKTAGSTTYKQDLKFPADIRVGKVISNFPDNFVEFQPEKFAEGSVKNAYMGTLKGTYLNDKCVVKIQKNHLCWTMNDWSTTFKNLQKAQELASDFQLPLGKCMTQPFYISFNPVYLVKVTSTPLFGTIRPKANEYVTAEPYLTGEYQKFSNNCGAICSPDNTMEAFMHWSWVASRGELMISGLQGVRNDQGYSLTDPAIMSLNREYGATDTGVLGMVEFLKNHQCNMLCQDMHLPVPTEAYLLSNPLLLGYAHGEFMRAMHPQAPFIIHSMDGMGYTNKEEVYKTILPIFFLGK